MAASLGWLVFRAIEHLPRRVVAPERRIARDVESADQRGRRHAHLLQSGHRHHGLYELDTLASRVEREARAAIAQGRSA